MTVWIDDLTRSLESGEREGGGGKMSGAGIEAVGQHSFTSLSAVIEIARTRDRNSLDHLQKNNIEDNPR
jgi:hypothetical protein